MKSAIILLAAGLIVGPAGATLAQAPPPAPVPTTAAVPAATDTVTLRYKYLPGMTRRYHMTMDNNGTIIGGPTGQAMPMKQHMDIRLHQTVMSVRPADGAATITMGIDAMTMTMNGQTMPFPASLLDPMKKLGTMVQTPTGKVLSFTANKAAGGGMPGMDLSKMGGMQSGTALPDGPVKAGDTWANTADLAGFGMPGMSAAATTLTLTGLDTTGGTQVADINTKTTADFSPPAQGAAATPFAMTGKVAATGSLKFDVAQGVVTSQTGTTHITMNMNPPGANAAAGTGPMTIAMTMLTRLDLLPADPATAAAVTPAAPAGPDPALVPRTGEVRLEGTLREISPGQHQMVLLASRVQEAGHEALAFPAPRPKTILVRTTTTLNAARGAAAALSTFQPGDSVIVVGKSAGTGQPLVARVIAAQ